MVVKTIEADDIKEAFRRVKEEMGRDAYILEVRSVRKNDGVLGLRGKMQVQVTVGDQDAVALHKNAKKTSAPANSSRLLEKTYQRNRVSSSAEKGTDGKEIAEIREIVEELLRRSLPDPMKDIEGPCRDFYRILTENDVPEQLARGLVMKVYNGLETHCRNDGAEVQRRICAFLRKIVKPYGPIRFRSSGPTVVILAGPTGVGKTTTIAKLAAIYKLDKNKNVGLITTDTYRIAAVSHLRTYAEIMKLPLRVVQSPEELRNARTSMADRDLILIDTAGRCQKDMLKMNELNAFRSYADPDEVHLVLSAVTGERVMKNVLDRFEGIEPDSIILTKVDEAVTCGSLLSIIARLRKAVSYITTGQDVPSDIELARPEKMAELIIGNTNRDDVDTY